MRRRGRVSNFTAGLVTLALVGLFTYGGFTKFRWPFGHHYEVHAVFRTAATELQKSSPIRIAGVEVGRVSGVEQGPGGTALVTMRIKDSGRPLHRDATMKIRPRLFLEGNFFVDVTPGTSGTPELEDGGTVPLSQTADAVQIDELLRTLQRPTRRDLQDTVKHLAEALDGGGARGLNRAFGDMSPAFKGVAVSAEAARGEHPGDLSRFVAAQRAVSGTLAARDQELAGLVTSFATTVTALADRRDDLGASLRALDRTMRTATPALAELRGALPSLRTFTAALRPALRVAPGVLDEATPFVRDASRLLGPAELPRLTSALRPAARSLATIEPQLGELLGKVTPVAACITRNVVPVLQAKLDDGDLSTGQPVWQELAHFPIGLAAAGETFDANGANIRYGAGGGENLVSTTLPGLGELYAMTERPLLGARPRYTPNRVPPFNSDARCTDQSPPDLKAETTPPPRQRRLSVSRSDGRDAIRAATQRLRRLGSAEKLRSAIQAAAHKDREAAAR